MYNTISKEKGLWSQIEDCNRREFTVQTGMEGLRLFNKTCKIEVLMNQIQNLVENGRLKNPELERIQQMIKSDDEENLEVASLIIYNYGITR